MSISYEAKTYNLPSNYIYLKTKIEEDIFGGAMLDQILKIEYLNSTGILDINNKEIKAKTYARVWIN